MVFEDKLSSFKPLKGRIFINDKIEESENPVFSRLYKIIIILVLQRSENRLFQDMLAI